MKLSKFLGLGFCVLGLHVATSDKVEAATILGFGGNSYQYVQVLSPLVGPTFQSFPANSWSAASAAASAVANKFMGVTGHLATITSLEENDFIASLVTNNPTVFAGAWLGGRAPGGWLEGPEGALPDPSFTYINWRLGEPNNSGFAYMSIKDDANLGKWLDDSIVPISGDGQGIPTFPNDPVIGYFIEYEGVTPIPLPAALPLFAGGLGLLGLLGWRRKRIAA